MPKHMKDVRSTGRRRLRKALFQERRPFWCEHCLQGPKELPKDFPRSLIDDFEFASPQNRTVSRLEANHIDKDLENNDASNGQWLCPSCHKILDSTTEKGQRTNANPYEDLI